MKFIIYICTRIRHGQHPRLPDFQYSEAHGKYIFRGKEMDAAEFNEAAALVFGPNYRNNTYSFCPEIIQAVEKPIVTSKPVEPVEPVEPSVVTPLDANPYLLEDDAVFFQGKKIALLSNGKVRMSKSHAHLREEVEAFINSTKQTP